MFSFNDPVSVIKEKKNVIYDGMMHSTVTFSFLHTFLFSVSNCLVLFAFCFQTLYHWSKSFSVISETFNSLRFYLPEKVSPGASCSVPVRNCPHAWCTSLRPGICLYSRFGDPLCHSLSSWTSYYLYPMSSLIMLYSSFGGVVPRERFHRK